MAGSWLRRVALALSVVVLAAGCTSGGAEEETTSGDEGAPSEAAGGGGDYHYHVIGFLAENAFWSTVGAGANQAAEDFGVRVTYSLPSRPNDLERESLIRSAISAQPDGIVLNYTGKQFERVTLEAIEAGIDVILFNNNRFEDDAGGATTDPRITDLPFVGQDETTSGQFLADQFMPLLEPNSNILIVNSNPDAFVLSLRATGLTEIFEANGHTTDILVGTDDEANNEALVASYLERNQDLDAIVGLNSGGTNPAARAVARTGRDEIKMATFDVNEAILEHLDNGTVDMILMQQPFLQGYMAVMNHWLKDNYGFYPVDVNTGTLIVTSENADDLRQLVDEGRS